MGNTPNDGTIQVRPTQWGVVACTTTVLLRPAHRSASNLKNEAVTWLDLRPDDLALARDITGNSLIQRRRGQKLLQTGGGLLRSTLYCDGGAKWKAGSGHVSHGIQADGPAGDERLAFEALMDAKP